MKHLAIHLTDEEYDALKAFVARLREAREVAPHLRNRRAAYTASGVSRALLIQAISTPLCCAKATTGTITDQHA